MTFPAYKSATLVSIRPSNLPNVTTNLTYTHWGRATYKVLQMCNGAYVKPEQTVLIPIDETDNVGSTGPWQPGDTITVAGKDPSDPNASTITYTIQVAMRDDYWWLLGVFNPKIAFNLRDTVDIVLNTGSVSSILTRTTSSSDVSTSVVCRKQPTSVQMMTLLGRQGNVRMFDVYFASNQTLLPDRHVLRWTESGSPVIADIVSVTDSERIDVCQKVTVEVRP